MFLHPNNAAQLYVVFIGVKEFFLEQQKLLQNIKFFIFWIFIVFQHSFFGPNFQVLNENEIPYIRNCLLY